MKRFIRKSEFGKLEGFTKSYTSWLLKKGIILETENGMIDRIESHRKLTEWRNRPGKYSRPFETPDFGKIDLNNIIKSLPKKERRKRI